MQSRRDPPVCLDTPIPFNIELEKKFYGIQRGLGEAVDKYLMKYWGMDGQLLTENAVRMPFYFFCC